MACLVVLEEANVSTTLTEALSAKVQAVLADQTGTMSADTAFTAATTKVTGMRVVDFTVNHFVVAVVAEMM